jgi:N-acetylglutamate synthase-like GNAT family acetyltransferase
MPSATYRVRRATLDDLAPLTELWKSMHFEIDPLAKRVTDFQVAESGDGVLLGAVAVQMAERQGLLHSEGYTDFGLADTLRALLWERIQALAANHGLWRVWTHEQSPFWRQLGFDTPDAEVLEKLPSVWRGLPPGWLTMKLKEDVDALLALDPEFALMMDAQKQQTSRLLQQARVLKTLATLLVVVVVILALAAAFLLFHRNPHLRIH